MAAAARPMSRYETHARVLKACQIVDTIPADVTPEILRGMTDAQWRTVGVRAGCAHPPSELTRETVIALVEHRRSNAAEPLRVLL